jgi:hypothetical protein
MTHPLDRSLDDLIAEKSKSGGGVCHTCSQPGHIARNCPKRGGGGGGGGGGDGGLCHTCNRPGHRARDCPHGSGGAGGGGGGGACHTCGRMGHKARDCQTGGGFKASRPHVGGDSARPFGAPAGFVKHKIIVSGPGVDGCG